MAIKYGTDGYDNIVGTNSDDALYGYAEGSEGTDTGGDYIQGGAGNDHIEGAGGDDWLVGADGDDVLLGGAGDDELFAGDGDEDRVDGGAGYDTAEFHRGFAPSGVTIDATDGITVVGIEKLTIQGSHYSDRLTGGDEIDIFYGGEGNDILKGGGGDDRLYAGGGTSDRVDGGAGYDIAYFERWNDSQGIIFKATDSTYVRGIEELYFSAGSGDDRLTGGAEKDEFYGGDGDDILKGGAGDDVLHAGGGEHDRIDGGAGYDVATIDRSLASKGFVLVAADVVGVEELTVYGGAFDDVIEGGDQVDDLRGGSGDDVISGGGGNDSLQGGDGSDRLSGGAGDDVLNVGLGADDRVDGGEGYDKAVYDRSGDVVGFVLDATDGVTVLGIERLEVTAGRGNDKLTGGAEQDVFRGGAGDDVLKGGAGDDVLYADAGQADRLDGGSGFDIGYFNRAAETANVHFDAADRVTAVRIEELHFTSGSGDDTLIGGAEADHFASGAGDDVLSGGDGDDVLDAGTGLDRVDGGLGYDIAFLSRADESADITFDMRTTTAVTSIEELVFSSGSGDDRLIGGDGTEAFLGGDGDDVLNGGAGDDFLYGEAGSDKLLGGAGDDVIDTGYSEGSDQVDGGAGYDRAVFFLTASRASLDATDGITIRGIEELTVYGTGAGNTIIGGAERDFLHGKEGDDILSGGAGDDLLDADYGDDRVDGGAGYDVALFGRAGVRSFTPVVFDATDPGKVSGVELLLGYGSWMADIMIGGAERDYLFGNSGNDILSGGAGDDVLDAGGGTGNQLDGGAGFDKARFDMRSGESGIAFDATDGVTAVDIEDVTVLGSAFADSLVGGDEIDRFYGFAGADSFIGGGGDDYLALGDGVGDTADGGDGYDTVEIDWSAATDTIVASFSAGLPYAGVEALVIFAGTGNDRLTGGAEDDHFIGGAGDDVLKGGAGDDILDAGAGSHDRVYGGSGFDTALFDRHTDATGFSFDATDGSAVDSIENLEVVGGSGHDRMTGGAEADHFVGNGGDDILIGGAGDDVLDAGTGGADWVDGGEGYDHALFDWSDRQTAVTFSTADGLFFTGIERLTVVAGSGADRLTGGAEADEFSGGAGRDVLKGGDGDDVLDGGTGADSLSGGSGDDVFIVDDAGDRVSDSRGNDTVKTSLADYALGDRIENLVMIGTVAGTATGNALDNEITSAGQGRTALVGGGGNDRFVFIAGSADGDALLDFDGRGAALGDSIVFSGYGTREDGASFTKVNATTWRVTSASGDIEELITVASGVTFNAEDVSFVGAEQVRPVDPLLLDWV